MSGIRYLFDTEGMMTPVENIRTHPDNDNNGDIDEIVASMRATGVYRPIYASRETGYILAGNHTYLALLELGARYVPVQWIDADDVAELRILAADNKIARNARPDPALTADLLRKIIDRSPLPTKDPEAALVGTGFGITEAERLLRPPKPLDLSGISRGTLEHTYKCPECGHQWSKSSGKEVD